MRRHCLLGRWSIVCVGTHVPAERYWSCQLCGQTENNWRFVLFTSRPHPQNFPPPEFPSPQVSRPVSHPLFTRPTTRISDNARTHARSHPARFYAQSRRDFCYGNSYLFNDWKVKNAWKTPGNTTVSYGGLLVIFVLIPTDDSDVRYFNDLFNFFDMKYCCFFLFGLLYHKLGILWFSMYKMEQKKQTRRYICVDPKATRTIDKSPRVKEINFYDRTHPSNFFHTFIHYTYAEKKSTTISRIGRSGDKAGHCEEETRKENSHIFLRKENEKTGPFSCENFILYIIYTSCGVRILISTINHRSFGDESFGFRRVTEPPRGQGKAGHVYIIMGWDSRGGSVGFRHTL